MVAKEHYFFRNPDTILKNVSEEGVLLENPDSFLKKRINRSGLFIWNLCDGGHSFGDIMSATHDTYDGIPAESAERSVKEFLDELISDGFIGVYEE